MEIKKDWSLIVRPCFDVDTNVYSDLFLLLLVAGLGK